MTPHSQYPIGTVAIMSGLPAVLWEFTWSLARMVAFNSQYVCGPRQFIHYEPTRHSLHGVARNGLAKTMQGEWLLMLDTDHKFDPDLLARMLNAMNTYRADVVTALYLKKDETHRPTLWKWQGDKYAQLAGWDDKQVLEIGAAGAGCLLVRRSVFERIEEEMHEEPFSTSEFPGVVGEDFAFFNRLRMLGIKPIVVPWIECHHLMVKPLVAAEDYDPDHLEPGEREVVVPANRFLAQAVTR